MTSSLTLLWYYGDKDFSKEITKAVRRFKRRVDKRGPTHICLAPGEYEAIQSAIDKVGLEIIPDSYMLPSYFGLKRIGGEEDEEC
jgi:hypothetical protein